MAEKLSPQQLLKQITGMKECPPSLLIVAQDEIRKDRIEKILLDTFLNPGSPAAGADAPPNLALTRIDAANLDKAELAKLKDDLSALSLFAKRRFISIRHAQELNADLQERLLTVLKGSGTANHIILRAESLPAGSHLRKHFAKENLLIELADMSGAEFVRWVEKELRSAGLEDVEEGVSQLLVSIAEESPDRAALLVEQAALYTTSKSLTLKDLGALFIHHTAPGDYDFIDAMSRGEVVKAETMLRSLLIAGKNPFLLLNLISRSFSSYLAIKAALSEGLSPLQVREKLKLNNWIFEKQLAAARRLPVDKLKRIMEDIMRADSKLKNRSLGNEQILSELIAAVAKP